MKYLKTFNEAYIKTYTGNLWDDTFSSEAKTKVLEKYPNAWWAGKAGKGYYGSVLTVIYSDGKIIGGDLDQERAWEDALKRLENENEDEDDNNS